MTNRPTVSRRVRRQHTSPPELRATPKSTEKDVARRLRSRLGHQLALVVEVGGARLAGLGYVLDFKVLAAAGV